MEINKSTCSSCKYFIQHYTLLNGHLNEVDCGHCIKPRVKTRKPETAACGHYAVKSPDKEALVSREYLTRALLEKLLSLQLAP